LSKADVEELTLRWRCSLASLRAADRGIRRLVTELADTGELERTVLVFFSDNGYFFGEHRFTGDKRLPYEATAHVPMAIAVPEGLRDGARPKRVDEPVGIADLAPTLLDYANVEPCLGGGSCRRLDGRSLSGLLEGDEEGWPRNRAILLELDDGYTYAALRTRRHLYAEYVADRRGKLPRPAIELYDMRSDPAQLRNLWQEKRPRARQLAKRLGDRLERLRR
jgi:arylsulfatase A-like enzyme